MTSRSAFRDSPCFLPVLLLLCGLALLAACSAPAPRTGAAPAGPASLLPPETLARYDGLQDGSIYIPPVPRRYLTPETVRTEVAYATAEPPGTIIVDPDQRRLYLVTGNGRALRYAVAVGEAGLAFSGNAVVGQSRAWPRWTPTPGMLEREPERYAPHRGGMAGGPDNPLGARALYLHRGGRDTLYRIHGTPYPQSVGRAASSGCIRLYQQDIIDLYGRIDRNGTRVVVLPGTVSYAPASVPAGSGGQPGAALAPDFAIGLY